MKLTRQNRTVVEIVHQLLLLQPRAHILLCAPSNPATDTLAVRLAKSGIVKPNEMLRLNDENRTFAEVPNEIRGYCCSFVFVITACLPCSQFGYRRRERQICHSTMEDVSEHT
jgi:hypothetical protein